MCSQSDTEQRFGLFSTRYALDSVRLLKQSDSAVRLSTHNNLFLLFSHEVITTAQSVVTGLYKCSTGTRYTLVSPAERTWNGTWDAAGMKNI